MAGERETLVREVLEAAVEYVEARATLSNALDKYDGYSPSWALSAQFNARDVAEKRCIAAINALLPPPASGADHAE